MRADGTDDRVRSLVRGISEIALRRERGEMETSLRTFVKRSWRTIDNSTYQDSWAIDALCEHLAAVTGGHIKRLLVNFPPRCGKSKIASVAWPAWTWAQPKKSFTSGPHVKFLCGSYNSDLSLELATDSRDLLDSAFYRKYWGDRVKLRMDRNAKSAFLNQSGGARRSSSVGGSLVGLGADIGLVDDPHNTYDVESDAERESSERWWKEFSSTRLNDPNHSAIVVIMQRLHEDDVSGHILSAADSDSWTHLMLPMRYDPDRHCSTVLRRDSLGHPVKTWDDPRAEDRELLWPQRFDEDSVRRLEINLGPYLASGRLQQSPSPQGGSIIEESMWQLWDKPQFPACHFVLASADTAYTEREENDPTGFTIWGVFEDPEDRCNKVILLFAWRKRLKLRGHGIEPKDNEKYQEWKHRTQERWGLIEWLADSCKKFKADHLLIESKASGITVADEVRRIHAGEGWHVEGTTPQGDKTARAVAVQGTFSSGLVYAPPKEWADMVIQEAKLFPKGRYKDLTDSTTQALSYLRKLGMLKPVAEVRAAELVAASWRPEQEPLYDV